MVFVVAIAFTGNRVIYHEMDAPDRFAAQRGGIRLANTHHNPNIVQTIIVVSPDRSGRFKIPPSLRSRHVVYGPQRS